MLIDIDPTMLDGAGSRLAAFGAHAELRRASFDDALPPCDAVVASLALHHVPERLGCALSAVRARLRA